MTTKVIKRDLSTELYTPSKIITAINTAVVATYGQAANVDDITTEICTEVFKKIKAPTVGVEVIQDFIVSVMYSQKYGTVAKAFEAYRALHALDRGASAQTFTVKHSNDEYVLYSASTISDTIKAAVGDNATLSIVALYEAVVNTVYDGMSLEEYNAAFVSAAVDLIQEHPAYSKLAAKLFITNYTAAVNDKFSIGEYTLVDYLALGVAKESLTPELLHSFDFNKLEQALDHTRNDAFEYLAIQTLYDRYFIRTTAQDRYELPQHFFMRVAMALAVNEDNPTTRAIEFYNVLSTFKFMASTPTLFNAGTLSPQLSSCFLTTVPDDLHGIFSAYQDTAMLSKYAGGLGNDWTNVRATGAHIKGTSGTSAGVIPFLKVSNDVAIAVNQSGKRRGAFCAYLETWHLDIEEFLELRKGTGDDRRRTHDMNTANWIPDLFMERVMTNGTWTLFSPDSVPKLHDSFGAEFKELYEYYESKTVAGTLHLFKTVNAVDLWHKMLNVLFETGHPWLTFKDPCNVRYPNKHKGVVHSSNLCTEITLHTNEEEIAVCNLGSINLATHTTWRGATSATLKATVATAVRMLDNVITCNYYAVDKAKTSSIAHRPIGLGIMGFQDALYIQGISYDSMEAVEFADTSTELISYLAISASSELARSRGSYPSYEGSDWSQGVMPIDTIKQLSDARGDRYLKQDTSTTLDWDTLRKDVQRNGMRNSTVMAIAPTATISNICGVSQSIEPTYQNLFVHSNLSGEFVAINKYLVLELIYTGDWTEETKAHLAKHAGSIQTLPYLSDAVRKQYKTAFEIDSRWLVEAASRRQKWIDQGQSLNLYMAKPSGAALDALYKHAWLKGLKTTYYLRSKAVIDSNK